MVLDWEIDKVAEVENDVVVLGVPLVREIEVVSVALSVTVPDVLIVPVSVIVEDRDSVCDMEIVGVGVGGGVMVFVNVAVKGLPESVGDISDSVMVVEGPVMVNVEEIVGVRVGGGVMVSV